MPTVKEYQDLIKDGCPRCGESLVLRKGKYGEFVACAEWCGYTKSIQGRSQFPPPKKQRRCPLNKCNGTGLISFKNRAGVIVPHTYLHCDCRNDTETFSDINPGDIDFPCSYSYRQFYEVMLTGKELPGLEPKPRRERIVREVTRFVVPMQAARATGPAKQKKQYPGIELE